jgi:hypothetical protein
MTTGQREKQTRNLRSDWWLWPSAALLIMAGWGQALWMWDNIQPAGLAPLALLFWIGLGVAGLTLAIYWFAHRWWLVAWLAVAAWLAVPVVMELAGQEEPPAQAAGQWLYDNAALLLLGLLGVGLSGAMMNVSWYAKRRWPGPEPNIRALRQGLWAGLFAMICGVLLISRAFSFPAVALLAGSLILIEAFLVVRESAPEMRKA